jgi:hypothetical protein
MLLRSVFVGTQGIVMSPKGKKMALLKEMLLALSVTNSVILAAVCRMEINVCWLG